VRNRQGVLGVVPVGGLGAGGRVVLRRRQRVYGGEDYPRDEIVESLNRCVEEWNQMAGEDEKRK
jgi:hypothetical protein